jgi:uncharacterized phage-associated protein
MSMDGPVAPIRPTGHSTSNPLGLPDEALAVESVRPSLIAVANDLITRNQQGQMRSTFVLDAQRVAMIVYFAHGHHVAIQGRWLADEAPRIRPWGPGFHSLTLAGRGDPIAECLIRTPQGVPDLDDHPATRAFLGHIEARYARYTTDDLTTLATRPGSAWRRAFTEWKRRPTEGATVADHHLATYFSGEVL